LTFKQSKNLDWSNVKKLKCPITQNNKRCLAYFASTLVDFVHSFVAVEEEELEQTFLVLIRLQILGAS